MRGSFVSTIALLIFGCRSSLSEIGTMGVHWEDANHLPYIRVLVGLVPSERNYCPAFGDLRGTLNGTPIRFTDGKSSFGTGCTYPYFEYEISRSELSDTSSDAEVVVADSFTEFSMNVRALIDAKRGFRTQGGGPRGVAGTLQRGTVTVFSWGPLSDLRENEVDIGQGVLARDGTTVALETTWAPTLEFAIPAEIAAGPARLHLSGTAQPEVTACIGPATCTTGAMASYQVDLEVR